ISRAFPDVMAGLTFDGAVDGELVVWRDGVVAPFADLQQRLNRKTVDAKLMAAQPAATVAYDLLAEDGEDRGGLRRGERRARLEAVVRRGGPGRHLRPRGRWRDEAELGRLRADRPVGAAAEGLMLKRRDSPYVAGRPKGPWF